MKEIDVLYEQIETECKQEFRKLYRERYGEIWLWLKKKKPDEDELDELVEMYLAGLWDAPNENTHYAFQSELIRKRDRAKEAVTAVPTRAQKQLELEKAARFVVQQIGWYSDFVSQDAEIQAFRDAGVKRVQRHEMDDDRVCRECRRANGEIYLINRVPALPHLRCRRWFTPVS